jgi:hypothetical protein
MQERMRSEMEDRLWATVGQDAIRYCTAFADPAMACPISGEGEGLKEGSGISQGFDDFNRT